MAGSCRRPSSAAPAPPRRGRLSSDSRSPGSGAVSVSTGSSCRPSTVIRSSFLPFDQEPVACLQDAPASERDQQLFSPSRTMAITPRLNTSPRRLAASDLPTSGDLAGTASPTSVAPRAGTLPRSAALETTRLDLCLSFSSCSRCPRTSRTSLRLEPGLGEVGAQRSALLSTPPAPERRGIGCESRCRGSSCRGASGAPRQGQLRQRRGPP